MSGRNLKYGPSTGKLTKRFTQGLANVVSKTMPLEKKIKPYMDRNEYNYYNKSPSKTTGKRKIKGQNALEEDEVYNGSASSMMEEKNRLKTDPILTSPVSYPIEESTKDLSYGIRGLFILHLFWTILNFAGFLTLLIYRSVIVVNNPSKILTIFLTTSFPIFNSDPINHVNKFYPQVWESSRYYIDIPMIIVLAIAFVCSAVRTISIWASDGLINRSDVQEGPMFTVYYKKDETLSTGGGVTSKESQVMYFEEENYTETQWNNFYISQVLKGNFWFRWIEWMIGGGALIWAVMTLSPIQDDMLLACLLMMFGGVIFLGFMHEYVNRIKPSNINLSDPVAEPKGKAYVDRRPKKWWAYIIGLVLQSWLWVVIFSYYGYADNFNPGSYQWFRLAVPPITIAFFLLIIPIIMIIWTIGKPTKYMEFRRKTVEKLNETMTNEQLANIKEDNTFWDNYDESKHSFWDLTDQQRKRLIDYASYQDWNKNVAYEILMTSSGFICAHVVIWILWIGMLTTL
jgi:hypothetical protein